MQDRAGARKPALHSGGELHRRLRRSWWWRRWRSCHQLRQHAAPAAPVQQVLQRLLLVARAQGRVPGRQAVLTQLAADPRQVRGRQSWQRLWRGHKGLGCGRGRGRGCDLGKERSLLLRLLLLLLGPWLLRCSPAAGASACSSAVVRSEGRLVLVLLPQVPLQAPLVLVHLVAVRALVPGQVASRFGPIRRGRRARPEVRLVRPKVLVPLVAVLAHPAVLLAPERLAQPRRCRLSLLRSLFWPWSLWLWAL